ncbi:MAG: 4Fe-4S binding protein [Phycisphaerae bacterium]|jgi:ferredoxin
MKYTRRLIQLAFLTLTVVAVFVVRGNAERWCPFGGVEAIYQYTQEGNLLCSLGVSNFYVLAAVLLSTLLLRRAFCSYICPLGTVSEWLGAGARKLGLPQWRVPHALDRVLALLKYVVLVAILYFTWRVGELVFRGYDPCYALLSRHGEDITIWAYVICGVLVVASLLVMLPLCRWLCPLAAVLNPFSWLGLTRIRRGDEACIECGACAAACPMGIRVDRVREVTAARCTGCFECTEACPTRGDGALVWGPPKKLGRSWPRGALVAVLLACIGGAVVLAYALPLPSFVHTRGTPPAEIASVELGVHDLTCRGRANLFVYYVERDDYLAVPGYLRIEAWPGPGAARCVISYDPAETDESQIKAAITEPYFDALGGSWRPSPFRIEGYDPLFGEE